MSFGICSTEMAGSVCFLVQVMTKYSHILGAKKGEWVDVFALDDDSLEVIPKPVNAVVLLFPISEGVSQQSIYLTK